jgi:hypothetical protein
MELKQEFQPEPVRTIGFDLVRPADLEEGWDRHWASWKYKVTPYNDIRRKGCVAKQSHSTRTDISCDSVNLSRDLSGDRQPGEHTCLGLNRPWDPAGVSLFQIIQQSTAPFEVLIVM